MQRIALSILLVACFALSVSAQFLGGDIRALDTPDTTRAHTRFTARCVGPTGEFYLQRARNSDIIDVFASVAAFTSGASATRSITCTTFGQPSGNQMTWCNGWLYAATTASGGVLARFNPMTGAISPSTIPQGAASPGWGGGAKSMIGCDGTYLFVHRDSTLAVYDLNEVLLRSVPTPLSIGDYGSSFAAGGYYYPIEYPNQALINERISGATGAITPWSTNVNVPCSYQVCASFDYFFNTLSITGGNAPAGCNDFTFVWNDVLDGGPQIRTVVAAATQVAPGQTGVIVSYDVENTGTNALTVNSASLTFEDSAAAVVTTEYTISPDPSNPTSIAAAATETFMFTVDVGAAATLGAIVIDGTISTTDSVTMAVQIDPDADVTDSWDVIGAKIAVRTVDAIDSSVAQGGQDRIVNVTVENIGLNEALVSSIDLSFTGAADRTAEYVVTPDPGNPTAIAAGASLMFMLLVDVDPAASVELITIDAGFSGADAISGAPAGDTDADIVDTWQVLECLVVTCGDCNSDGIVSILDALLAAQHSAVLTTLTGQDFSNCNAFGTLEPLPGAVVDILDALSIAQAAAGLPAPLACC